MLETFCFSSNQSPLVVYSSRWFARLYNQSAKIGYIYSYNFYVFGSTIFFLHQTTFFSDSPSNFVDWLSICTVIVQY